MEVGDVVVWHDPKGEPHNALLTAVWPNDVVNLVLVSSDETRRDDYGRQVERQTSVVHRDKTSVHGNYWRHPLQTPRPYAAPTSI